MIPLISPTVSLGAAEFAGRVFPKYSHKGTNIQKFYDNLKLFGFKKNNKNGTFHHPDFKRGNYNSVEQHCRKNFRSIQE